MKKLSKSFILKEKELEILVEYILKEISSGTRVILLEGNLGAGKTKFTSELIKHFLPDAVVQSPTYVIEKVYETESKVNQFIHHLDLYRIKYYSEFIDLGFHDLIQDKNRLFIIEWPDLIEQKIPHWLKISIEDQKNGKAREYKISKK